MPAEAPILMIRQDESYTKNKFEGLTSKGKEITFPSGGSNSSAPVVIKAKIFGREVNRVHMDNRISCETTDKIPLEITIGDAPLTRKETLDFMIVKSDSPYNMLLGRKTMQKMGIVVSTIHGAIKFHITRGIGMVFSTHKSDKNAGATYQRLVDKGFHNQVGRNLEAYVDDMVIKSTSEEEMLADIKETFKKFLSINMKLNPKKCSFGVEEGPFLGHLITKQGIRANPSKVKSITDVEQLKTVKDV
ncbi:reverse transcriptase domain-containing protein [Tanacetum coccineum]